MKRIDLSILLALLLVAVLIYFPVFNTEYLYTDESVQLWFYKKDPGFHMFTQQGRYVTDLLFQWLFGMAHTTRDVTAIRIFSFGGWMLSIPVWYFILKRIVVKEGLPGLLPGFAVLYLICTPVFTISVSWASCLELFLANTTGLLAGYFFYKGIIGMEDGRRRSLFLLVPGALMGLISLFTYQNGFGCFLLPFLLRLLAKPAKWRVVLIGVGGYFALAALYYGLFIYSLGAQQMDVASRTAIHIDAASKFKFFFGRPLASAYHFTYLVNEKNRPGILFSMLLFGLTLIGYRGYMKGLSLSIQAKQVALIILLLLIIYLPSLVVKESYSSNRTLLALDMAVFLFFFLALLPLLQQWKMTGTFVTLISILFIFNAGYNLRSQFMKPVVREYTLIRAAIESGYHRGIDTLLFIRPGEDLYVKKYGITRSWDEFGVPFTFFEWVPEFFIKQVIYEKTGHRKTAEKVVVRSWLGQEGFSEQPARADTNTVVIDAEKILKED